MNILGIQGGFLTMLHGHPEFFVVHLMDRLHDLEETKHLHKIIIAGGSCILLEGQQMQFTCLLN